MKTAVIDTNVFISSLISPAGIPAKIMELAHAKKFTLLVSYAILNEYAAAALYPVIQKRHGLSKKQMEENIFRLAKIGRIITPENPVEVIHEDTDDNKFLECAVEGGADFIISGDQHLKNLKSHQGIRIVDPAAFWAMYG